MVQGIQIALKTGQITRRPHLGIQLHVVGVQFTINISVERIHYVVYIN